MAAVIRCQRCYAVVAHDDEPHLDAKGWPCKPLPIWPIPVAAVGTWVLLFALLARFGCPS